MAALHPDVMVSLTAAAVDMPALSTDTLLAVAAAIGTIATAVTAVVRGTRSGLGVLGQLPRSRRRRLADALRRIDVGQTFDTFCKILGHQPTRRVRDASGLAHTFECGDVDVVARTDDVEAVTSYTVVARNRKFTPTINLSPNSGDPLVIRLCKTRFADIGTPNGIDGWLGANSYHYGEVHYYGRPGGYRYFRLESGDSGEQPDAFFTMLRDVTFTDDDRTLFGSTPALADARVHAARTATAITGYTVLADVNDRVWA